MKIVSFLFSLGVLVTACGVKGGAPSNPDPEGIKWVLEVLHTLPNVAITGQDVPSLILEKGTGKANGSGGCNNFFAGYVRNNDTIDISNIASTKKFCVEIQELENAYFAALDAANRCIVNGKKLELYKDNNLLAHFKKG